MNTIDTISPICQNTFDGEIEVEGSGGSPGYVYSWSNGVTTATGILSSIDTGAYSNYHGY